MATDSKRIKGDVAGCFREIKEMCFPSMEWKEYLRKVGFSDNEINTNMLNYNALSKNWCSILGDYDLSVLWKIKDEVCKRERNEKVDTLLKGTSFGKRRSRSWFLYGLLKNYDEKAWLDDVLPELGLRDEWATIECDFKKDFREQQYQCLCKWINASGIDSIYSAYTNLKKLHVYVLPDYEEAHLKDECKESWITFDEVSTEDGENVSDVQSIIKKITKIQQQKRGNDVVLLEKLVDEKKIPVVHPKMYDMPGFYTHGQNINDEYSPTERSSVLLEHKPLLTFDELSLSHDDFHFLTIIGSPGSGKTTISKRLANKFGSLFCLYLRFKDMSYPTELTLQQFLIDFQFPELNKSECRIVFEWMVENPCKCVIIMDGYDQATWKLECPPKFDYATPMHIQFLVASLCNKFFFPKCYIIITARPFAINGIPQELRPEKVVYLHELDESDMELLLNHFTPQGEKDIQQRLKENAPLLLDLCGNVLMLQFTVIAASHQRSVKDKRMTSMTGMFLVLLNYLKRSVHSRGNLEIKNLSTLAFNATDRGTVVIHDSDLEDAQLQSEEVQDLTIAMACGDFSDLHLFEGKETKFFTHQAWQEFLSAFYLSNVSEEQFEDKIDEVVNEDKWVMVRRFLCGLLLGKNSSFKISTKKKQKFRRLLLERFQKLANDDYHKQMLELMIDLLECDPKEIKQFAAHFPKNAEFRNINFGAVQALALSKMFENVTKPLEVVGLRNTYPSITALKKICTACRNLKIEVLDLSFNLFETEAVDVICEVIPYVTDELLLCGAFKREDGGMRQPNDEERDQLSAARFQKNKNLKIWRTTNKDF